MTFTARLRMLLLSSPIIALGLLVGLLAGLDSAAQAQAGVPLPGPRLAGAVQFPPGTGANPGAAIFQPDSGYVYIPGQDDLTVVSGTRVITTFVGMGPRSAQVNPGDDYLYAFTYTPYGLQVIWVISGTAIVNEIPLDATYAPATERVMVTNPHSGYVYVAPGLAEHEVLVLAGGQIIARVPVPLSPTGLTAGLRDDRVYVTLAGSSRVAVLAGTQVSGEVLLEAAPYQMVAHPATGYVYAASPVYSRSALDVGRTPSTHVSVISDTNVLDVVSVDEFVDVMLADPANSLLYLGATQIVTDRVTVISGTEKTGTLSLGGRLARAAAARSGYAYFVTFDSDRVTVVSGTQVVAALDAGVRAPQLIAAAPDSDRVYVGGSRAAGPGGLLSVVSGTQTLATWHLDGQPDDLAFDPHSPDIYVTSRATQDVTLVRNGDVLGSISQAPYPLAAEYNPVNGYTYVVNARSGIIDRIWVVGSQKIVAEIPIPRGAEVPATGGAGEVLTVSPTDGRVYLPGYNDRSIRVIQGFQFSSAITGLSDFPYQVAVDPSGRYIYAAEVYDQFRLAVIDGGRVVAELPGMPDFFRVKTNPVTGVAYAFGDSNLVHVVQGAVEIGVLDMRSKVADVAFDERTGDVYIGDADGVALARGKDFVGYLPVGPTDPFSQFGPLAYDPVHGYLYASTGSHGRTLVISGTRQIATIYDGGINPFAIHPDPDTGRVYLLGRTQIGVITGTQLANTVALPGDLNNTYVNSFACDLAIDRADGTLYVTDYYLHQLTLLAARPDFNLAPLGAPWHVRPGTTATHRIELVSQLGFSGPISLSIDGTSCGLAWQIEPNPAPAPGSVTVTLSAAPYAPFGPSSLQLTGVAQGITHEIWFTVLTAQQALWLPIIGGGPPREIEPGPPVWPTWTPWPTDEPQPEPTTGPPATPCPQPARCMAGGE